MSQEQYFLSAENPVANRDQCEAEEQALRVLATPALKEGRQRIAFLWKLAYGVNASEQAWSSFEAAMDENAMNYLLKAVASDGNYPKPVRLFMPPHEWFGRTMPGARIGGDNPDNCYRLIGIHPGVRYEISGHPVGQAAASVTFTLVANYGTSQTIQTLDYDDMDTAEDGSFTLIIDDGAQGGRRNHLRSAPEVKFLYIRDSMMDWAVEAPLALTVKRIDPPDAPPLTDAQVAERAVKAMVDDVPLYYWFTRQFSGKQVNTMSSPSASGALGGLIGQAGAQGWYQLEDDDAYILHFDPAGARYYGFVAHDWWFRSADCWRQTSSLTGAMMKPDPDGTFTAVLSLQDPGVHNWLSPGGLKETLTLLRWQGLPRQQVRQGPFLETRHVKFSELAAALPDSTVTVTAAQRQQQIDERMAAFDRRLIDR